MSIEVLSQSSTVWPPLSGSIDDVDGADPLELGGVAVVLPVVRAGDAERGDVVDQSVCAQLSPSTRTTYPSSRAFRRRVSPYRQSFERCFQRNLSSPSSEMRKRTACSWPSRSTYGIRTAGAVHVLRIRETERAEEVERETLGLGVRLEGARTQPLLIRLQRCNSPAPRRPRPATPESAEECGVAGRLLHCCTRVTGG